MQISNTKFSAITIDTSVFKNNSLKLEEGLLAQLCQFKNSSIQFILSDIVHLELRKHLLEKTEKTINDLSAVIKDAYILGFESTLELKSSLELLIVKNSSAEKIIDRRLEDFYKNSGAVTLNSCSADIEIARLVEMYFGSRAPFEMTGSKKNEFPDALALLSMEAWAERNNLFLLAVSSDKGWENFAKNSSRIAVTDKLDIALSTLQPIHFIKNNGNNLPVVISSYEKNVMEFQSIFAADEHNSILEAIDLAIIDSLDGIEIQADACSSYYFEEDYLETEYSYHEIVLNDDDVPEIHVIRADSNEVIIELSALVTCKISASFRLSTWDSMDKEYICVGSTSKKQTETYQTDILITLAGTRQALHKNLNTAEKTKALEILKIEILKDALDVHFGDLELDWD